jgi:UDP-3-O-[3-hydroxymyristoyl] glucosamine N-acyltransferase
MPSLAEIASILGVVPPTDPRDAQRAITGVGSLADASATEISFINSDAFLKAFATTRAGGVVASKRVRLPAIIPAPVLVVENADLAIARILELFAPPTPRQPAGIDCGARVAHSAVVGEGASVGFNVYIGERARIGRGTVLHPGVYIGDDTVVGEDCQIVPNVVVRERVTIGNRVTIHANSALGSDGFGYRWDGAGHAKIPQIGSVIVEDDVEIGSCSCIDRAKFGATRVGRGTKIDNLVQIGHNASIGPHCIIVGQAGMAGSAVLGTGVVLGGQTAVRDHTTVGDGAMAAACSGIADDVPPKAVVSGVPAIPHRQTLREQAALRRLPDLVVQVRKLRERLESLEGRVPSL